MRLTVVGCSGSFPGPASPASCYLVEAAYEGGTFRLVLDLGSGALGYLQRYVALESVDAVILSHLHADHCLDMCSFYVVRKYNPSGPMKVLPVYGPEGTGDRIARAYDLPSGASMSNQFDFRGFPDKTFALGPFQVTVALVDHPVAAYAIKLVDAGRTLVYSGDTALCTSLAQIAEGADVLLAEASLLDASDNPGHLHMTGEEAASVAQRAQVRELVLTHIPPWHSPDDVLAEAAPHFTGLTSLARPGGVFEI
jgi:ribonuclease BN (tRNA processing enzyme)